jgi:hypothetical protein
MKKGAGASPLFELTPQKPNPSRGSGPATPGSQSHVLPVERAIVVPASGRPGPRLQRIDFTGAYDQIRERNPERALEILQNLTATDMNVYILWEHSIEKNDDASASATADPRLWDELHHFGCEKWNKRDR